MNVVQLVGIESGALNKIKNTLGFFIDLHQLDVIIEEVTGFHSLVENKLKAFPAVVYNNSTFILGKNNRDFQLSQIYSKLLSDKKKKAGNCNNCGGCSCSSI